MDRTGHKHDDANCLYVYCVYPNRYFGTIYGMFTRLLNFKWKSPTSRFSDISNTPSLYDSNGDVYNIIVA